LLVCNPLFLNTVTITDAIPTLEKIRILKTLNLREKSLWWAPHYLQDVDPSQRLTDTQTSIRQRKTCELGEMGKRAEKMAIPQGPLANFLGREAERDQKL
jgi:hypothetical protein